MTRFTTVGLQRGAPRFLLEEADLTKSAEHIENTSHYGRTPFAILELCIH